MNTTREIKEQMKRRGGIDPAALAAASLAAAVSTLGQSGPYTPITAVVAFTLFLLVSAYDIEAYRTKFQSWAYSAVVGLIAALGIGFPLECVFGSCLSKASDSSVPQWASVASWLVITCLTYLLDSGARKRWQQIAA